MAETRAPYRSAAFPAIAIYSPVWRWWDRQIVSFTFYRWIDCGKITEKLSKESIAE